MSGGELPPDAPKDTERGNRCGKELGGSGDGVFRALWVLF